jgi:rhamnosyltransferase
MATYNGEKYVKNQILSILQQTYEKFRLLIRDDGSLDDTVRIVQEMAKFDSRICLIEDGAGQRLGPGRNFLGLLEFATSDYAMFCDQDDIWFEKKLEILVRFAENNFVPSVPNLVYCDAYAYSEEGVIIFDSVSRFHANNLREFIFFNSGYQGSSMLFDRFLVSLASNYKADYFYMHDDIVSLLAHVFGKVHYIPQKLMLYRQHDSNVTGNIKDNFAARLKKLFDGQSYVLNKEHYEEKKSFFDAYKNMISDEHIKIFQLYIEFPFLTLKERMKTVWINRFSYGGNRWFLLLKTLLQKPMS